MRKLLPAKTTIRSSPTAKSAYQPSSGRSAAASASAIPAAWSSSASHSTNVH
ncbi:hypothetical protein [Streptomyces sp. NPDC006527]|uniref:hypothetical protein n=1 Tax=Streptomyces sp. NPDC006527 TaxID=3364749 RepID=UPI00367EC4D1